MIVGWSVSWLVDSCASSVNDAPPFVLSRTMSSNWKPPLPSGMNVRYVRKRFPNESHDALGSQHAAGSPSSPVASDCLLQVRPPSVLCAANSPAGCDSSFEVMKTRLALVGSTAIVASC